MLSSITGLKAQNAASIFSGFGFNFAGAGTVGLIPLANEPMGTINPVVVSSSPLTANHTVLDNYFRAVSEVVLNSAGGEEFKAANLLVEAGTKGNWYLHEISHGNFSLNRSPRYLGFKRAFTASQTPNHTHGYKISAEVGLTSQGYLARSHVSLKSPNGMMLSQKTNLATAAFKGSQNLVKFKTEMSAQQFLEGGFVLAAPASDNSADSLDRQINTIITSGQSIQRILELGTHKLSVDFDSQTMKLIVTEEIYDQEDRPSEFEAPLLAGFFDSVKMYLEKQL